MVVMAVSRHVEGVADLGGDDAEDGLVELVDEVEARTGRASGAVVGARR